MEFVEEYISTVTYVSNEIFNSQATKSHVTL